MKLKQCNRCKENKPSEEFGPRSGRQTGTLKSHCRVCENEVHRRRRKGYKEVVDVVFPREKCERCGYNKCKAALDYHHVDPTGKLFSISSNVNRALSSLLQEAEKCIVLCANCHRELQHEERQLQKQNL